jgi:hypothetical protein
MSKSIKLTKVGEYRKSGTGNKVATFSVSGSKDAVAEYVADKTAELGTCPTNDDGSPRVSLLAGQYSGKNYNMQKSTNGKWSVIDNSNAAQLKDMIAQERDPSIKAELCKLYAGEVLAGMSRTTAAPVAAPIVDEKL